MVIVVTLSRVHLHLHCIFFSDKFSMTIIDTCIDAYMTGFSICSRTAISNNFAVCVQLLHQILTMLKYPG